MALAPGHLVAIAFAVLGVSLVLGAYLGGGLGLGRLLTGFVFLAVALLTWGVQVLSRAGAGSESNVGEGN